MVDHFPVVFSQGCSVQGRHVFNDGSVGLCVVLWDADERSSGSSIEPGTNKTSIAVVGDEILSGGAAKIFCLAGNVFDGVIFLYNCLVSGPFKMFYQFKTMNTYNSFSGLATANDMGCFSLNETISTEVTNIAHESEMPNSPQACSHNECGNGTGSKSFNNFAELMTASSQVVVDD